MKVRELIEQLQELNLPDAELVVLDSDGYEGPVVGIHPAADRRAVGLHAIGFVI